MLLADGHDTSFTSSARKAVDLGFHAVKAENTMNGPNAHGGLPESYDRHTDVVAALRDAIGPEITLMVDVQYLWRDAEAAASALRDRAEFDLYFLETPIWPDFVDEHRKLAEMVPIPIASWEMACHAMRI